MNIRVFGLVAVVGILLGACTQAQQGVDPKLLPPPITADEQVRRLREWSAAMPLLRGNSVPLGVRIEYQNDKGEHKQQNAEGTLVIRQHLAEKTPADVLLLGKAFDQPVFEAGRNATNWWFLIRLDTKTAWVGDSTKPVMWPEGKETRSSSILRADLVPELLGWSQMPAYEMRVEDFTGTNHLLVHEGTTSAGKPRITRELVVDRIKDELREVKLFNADGAVMVQSLLEDYHPVQYAEGAEKPAKVPTFPRKVSVFYPAQKMTIALQFESVTVPARIPDGAFRMNTEGVEVVHVE